MQDCSNSDLSCKKLVARFIFCGLKFSLNEFAFATWLKKKHCKMSVINSSLLKKLLDNENALPWNVLRIPNLILIFNGT